MSKGGGVTGYFLIYQNTTGYYFYDYGSTFVQSGTSASNGIGKWDYVVVTWDLSAKSFDMYVNGILSNNTQTNNTGTPSSTTSDLLISTNDATRGHNFWDGRMGVVKIYTSKLTSAQVAQNYLATKNDYPNGYNASISGATFLEGSSTPYYFDFDGSNDFMTIPQNTQFNFDVATTMQLWVNKDGTGREWVIDKANGGSGNYGWQLEHNNTL